MHYLDHATTRWPKPEAVYQALEAGFRQPPSPRQATQAIQTLRETLAHLVQAPQAEHIHISTGCTQTLHTVLRYLPWQAGDGIIISAIEHRAISQPVKALARERGIRFYVVPYTDATPFDLSVYEELLRQHPDIRWVITSHASNVTGALLPVEAIGQIARQYDKHYGVDAAQTAGLVPLDVERTSVSLLAMSAHKGLSGPPGISALYMAPTVAFAPTESDGIQMPSIFLCPEGERLFLPQIMAFTEGIRAVEEAGIESSRKQTRELYRYLYKTLREIPEITLYAPQCESIPVLSFNLLNHAPEPLARQLREQFNVMVAGGFHNAPMAHETLGTIHRGGTLRASLGHDTRPEDVEALLYALKTILFEDPQP